ncbi:MAG: hypothetical protein ABI772_01255 [Bacteroidota bacterium]
MRNYFLFVLILICSCNKNEPVSIHKYFDLKKYFETEASRLQSENMQLEKVLIKGVQSENVHDDSVNWSKTLAPFISCDINKPSWNNSYSVDSIRSDSSLVLIYKSLEENLPVRTIEVAWKNDLVTSVKIQKERNTYYYTSSETYEYHPAGFEMKGKQKVRMMDEVNYEITGTFIK